MLRSLSLATTFLSLFPVGARAVDLDALSGQAKRDACVAYVWIDITVRHDVGAMSDKAYANEKMRITNKLYTASGSTFGTGTEMRLEKAVDAIVAEDPDMAEVMNKAATCRADLRL